MRIVVDQNNPCVVEAFRPFGEVVPLRMAAIVPANIKDADVLIVRSETTVDRNLLDGTRIRFVGTATIGTDHVDLDYLREHAIGFASAPGSNANSVAEYVVAGLLLLSRSLGIGLKGTTLGVVGAGNVGSKVVRKAQALGMRVLQNDPPLARRGGGGPFIDLEQLMSADVVTLHVPLTHEGADATFHLFDRERIGRMKRGSVLINTARGAVVDSPALKEALASGYLGAAILDVWENEPNIDLELMNRAHVATPHIAGYSYDGKLNAVRMLSHALGEYLGVGDRWKGPAEMPRARVERLLVHRSDRYPLEDDLWEVVRQCYDIEGDDRALRALADVEPAGRGQMFRRLRAEYPVRREFAATSVMVVPENESLHRLLEEIGFSCNRQRA